jgi:lipooligosaccharide transport system permease protein
MSAQGIPHRWSPPRISLRLWPVWRRNLRVWRKLMVPSILGHFGEPVLYLLALGYGFGRLIGEINGLPYMVFLASGIVCSSAMFSASFEAMYSAFTRFSQQLTWQGMLNAPLDVDDIVLGEIVWAATKAVVAATAIMIVAGILGLLGGWTVLLVLPVIMLVGLCFASMAMVMTAVSPGYDFFMYYFTLVMTPMLLLSGVFFPLETFPPLISDLAWLLPLAHAVAVVRPLMIGELPPAVVGHLAVLAVYGLAGMWLSLIILRRKLLG